MRGFTLPLFKDRNLLFPVNSNGNGLSQFSVAFALGCRFSSAHHGVKPVKAEVPEIGFHGCRENKLTLGVKLCLIRVISRSNQIPLPHIHARNLRTVVIALQEFCGHRNRFLFKRHHDAVNKG